MSGRPLIWVNDRDPDELFIFCPMCRGSGKIGGQSDFDCPNCRDGSLRWSVDHDPIWKLENLSVEYARLPFPGGFVSVSRVTPTDRRYGIRIGVFITAAPDDMNGDCRHPSMDPRHAIPGEETDGTLGWTVEASGLRMSGTNLTRLCLLMASAMIEREMDLELFNMKLTESSEDF